jgi:hypothetical protein
MGAVSIDEESGVSGRFDFRGTSIRLRTTLLAAALCVPLLLVGCKSLDEPTTVPANGSVSAEAVQATMTAAPAPKGTWPEKVGSFAATYGKRVWYPTYIPKSFVIDSVEVIEPDPGTGLVCDLAFTRGEDYVVFTQGSEKARAYDIVSVGKVPWGDQQADVVHEDPSDTSTRKMIVLSNADGLAELSGSVSFEELKSVAASMVPVK